MTNSKYLNTCDPSKLENYLLSIDTNNLYGWALSQKLASKEFNWIEPNIRSLDEWKPEILTLKEGDWLRFECDLEYPKEFCNEHKDLPLVAEH